MAISRAGVLLLLAGSWLTLASRCTAQQPRNYALSAGYAYARVDSSAGGVSLHGISFSLARSVNQWLAIVGDGGGYHLEGFRLGTLQAGAKVTSRVRRVSVFAQVLGGWAHANAGGRGLPSYHDSVAWMTGGGADYRLTDRISLRLGEVDYLQTRLGSEVQHNLRAGAGIVVHFGAAR